MMVPVMAAGIEVDSFVVVPFVREADETRQRVTFATRDAAVLDWPTM
jgi:hypothetical protein